MSNRLLIKKSSVATKVPVAGDLEYGELAINYTDEKIYFKNASNLIKSFSSSAGTVTSVAALTIGTTGTDITSTVATGTTTPVITLNVPTASAANRGALSAADWTTFNNKVGSLTDTLATVTARGATTATASSFTGGLSASNLTITQATQNTVVQSFNGTGGASTYVDFAAVQIGGQTSNGAWLRWTRGGSNDRNFSIHTTDSAATAYKTAEFYFSGATITGTLTVSSTIGASNLSGTNTGDNPGVTAVAGVTPIISSGGTTPSISHATSGVGAGTYNNVTVNTFGHVTAGSNTAYLTGESDTLQTVTTRGNTTTTAINSNTSAAINLVTAGNQGAWLGGFTDATTGWTLTKAVMALKSDDATYSTIGIAPTNGALYFARTSTGAGTLTSWLTVNASGVANFLLARPQWNGTNLVIASDVVSSIAATSPIVASASTGAVTLSHAASGATAGTYNNVTVNATGHVTAGSNVAYSTTTGTVTSVATSGGYGGLTLTGGTITTTGTITMGGTPTGTWPISVSGSSTSTPLVSIDNSIAYGRSGLQFVQISSAAGDVATATNAPTADWWHIIRANHANALGYYTDLALPMTAATNIRYRRIASGTSSGWITVWDSTNLTNLNQLANGPGYGTGTVTAVTATTPIVSSGGTTPNITHATSGVGAGTYNNVTVNTFGHVTAGSNAGYLTGESDTLATVTARGNTTTTSIQASNLNPAYTVSDFDAIKAPGLYQYDGAMTSTPNSDANYRTIEIGSSTRYSQIALNYSSDGMWFRRRTDAVWSTWRQVWHSGNLTNLNQLTNGPGYGTGTVTAVTATTPIVSSGGTTPNITHATSGATAGTYNNVTVNTFGHVTAGSNVGYISGYTEVDTLATVTGRGNTTTTSVAIGASSVPNGKLYVNSAAVADTLAIQSSTTGTYLVFADNTTPTWANAPRIGAINNDLLLTTLATERVRITSAGGVSFGSTGTAYGTAGQVLQSNGNAVPSWVNHVTSIAANTPIVTSAATGAVTLSHSASGVTAGTYNNVTVNVTGHVTAGSNVVYLTGEVDTLATVTARGNVATGSIQVPPNSSYRFWGNDDTYSIKMAAASDFYYGPVTDYSLKLTMSSGAGRGITFGQNGVAPVAAINTTSGNMQIAGTFSALSKSFLIDHPTKPGMQLRYGSLEGPENGVYIRGRLKGNKIELPEYWTKLVDPDSITVNLTAIGKSQDMYVEDIIDNVVYVGGENVNCFYTVYAERVDIAKLEVEIG